MPRLVQCYDCLTVEVLPDFLGPPAEMVSDPLIRYIVARHRGPLNRQQLSGRPSGVPRVREIRDELIPCDMCDEAGCQYCAGTGKLQREQHRMHPIFVVAMDDWLDPQKRAQTLRQLWDDHVGYPDEFYDTKDTFRDDAVACFWKHNAPGSATGPDGCIDYEDSSKRLTDEAWQQRGQEIGVPRKHVFLCNFCPYSSVVMTRKRTQRGDYA